MPRPHYYITLLHSAEDKVDRTVEKFCKSYEAFNRRLGFSVMPTVDSFFRKTCLLFKIILSHFKMVEQECQLFGERRSFSKLALIQAVCKPEKIVSRTSEIICKQYQCFNMRQSVTAQQRKNCRYVNARRRSQLRRPDFSFGHKVFQVLR